MFFCVLTRVVQRQNLNGKKKHVETRHRTSLAGIAPEKCRTRFAKVSFQNKNDQDASLEKGNSVRV